MLQFTLQSPAWQALRMVLRYGRLGGWLAAIFAVQGRIFALVDLRFEGPD